VKVIDEREKELNKVKSKINKVLVRLVYGMMLTVV
jgi:hypothetical protein